jgi:hypothetical protein
MLTRDGRTLWVRDEAEIVTTTLASLATGKA